MKKKTIEYDTAEFLVDDDLISGYLTDALINGSHEEFILALNTVVRAKGITKLAKEARLGRESLYKTLDTATKPRFETILKILNALDIQIKFSTKSV